MKSFYWFFLCLFVGFFTLIVNPILDRRVSQALAKDAELMQRDYMIKISRQLGVTCAYCHNVNNFKDKSMATYKVSAEHIHMVEMLNAKTFAARNGPKADCYMCHKGKAVPDYKEPAAEAPTKSH
ncbi:MAG: photosynthetic reaction center cytochrome c subunit family protein [Bdellovibrionales bacterium]